MRLYDFLDEHDILYEHQFGFRKFYSTAYSLIEITEQIKSTIDTGKYGCGIFIDLKKAFYTVNHNILFAKLEHYGIRGNILKWFESYLLIANNLFFTMEFLLKLRRFHAVYLKGRF